MEWKQQKKLLKITNPPSVCVPSFTSIKCDRSNNEVKIELPAPAK